MVAFYKNGKEWITHSYNSELQKWDRGILSLASSTAPGTSCGSFALSLRLLLGKFLAGVRIRVSIGEVIAGRLLKQLGVLETHDQL